MQSWAEKKDPTWWDLEFLIWIKLTIKESRVDVIQLAAKPMFWKSHPLDANGLVERLKRKSSTSLDFGTGRLIKTKKPCKKRSRKLHQRFWFSNLAQKKMNKSLFLRRKNDLFVLQLLFGIFHWSDDSRNLSTWQMPMSFASREFWRCKSQKKPACQWSKWSKKRCTALASALGSVHSGPNTNFLLRGETRRDSEERLGETDGCFEPMTLAS